MKNIGQLTLSDEAEQQKLEQVLAESVRTIKQNNIQAFSIYAPYLLDFFNVFGDDTLSIFCTKQGKANIVDYSTGQCWYGGDPETEIKNSFKRDVSQVAKISLLEKVQESAPFIDYVEGTPFISPESFCSMQGEAADIEGGKIPLLIQFGIGIGHILKAISDLVEVDNWLVYEPSIEVFKASVDVFDWASWLEQRIESGQQVYLQIGNNAATLVEDLQHIASEISLTEAYVYRHYHHSEMDSLYQYLTSSLFSWRSLLDGQVSLVPFTDFCDEIPPLSTSVKLADSVSSRISWMEAQQRFLFNLQALDYYYPEVAQAFRNYVPQKWHLVLSESNKWNLLHIERNAAFYGDDGAEESNIDLEIYKANPLKDDPLLNTTGGKLYYYNHYLISSIIKKIIRDSSQDDIVGFPEKVNSIILFGLGLGYQLSQLVKEHEIVNLYLYETNFDFFYASLYVIDWGDVLKKLDESKGRLYLNLGDDGSHAREDLTKKINDIGPYNIVSTYIYSIYHHSVIQQAIFDLKQEFKVIVSMGEYFEHARYGISHTQKVFASENAYLVKRTALESYAELVDYPVFIVGNGPSLDSSFEYIKENRDKAIIISCGTALRALYSYGIKPDIHAEIEQNRATYDWVSNAADRDFLKKITLLSVNGIHPDTAELFAKTMIILKAGEASTRAYTTTVCPLQDYPELDFAHPTVSNLAVSAMCAIGMKNLYLFGIDLGFKELDYHHSKQSDYYVRDPLKKGEGESAIGYDYAKAHGVIPVAGNFQEQVFTKHEFRVSAKNMERVLVSSPDVLCFNCSDGAKILGAVSKKPNEIYLPKQGQSSDSLLEKLLDRICLPPSEVAKLAVGYEEIFNIEHLKRDVDAHLVWIKEQCPTSALELEELLSTQRELFHHTLIDRSSMFFFMFWGSMNYISSLILKVAYTSKDDLYESRLKRAWDVWGRYMEDVFYDYYSAPHAVDKTGVKNKNFVTAKADSENK